ncbi:hypothetical protein BGZ95_011113 [Linnemannia exigua]|uniref:Uncharacterized protein n=1 Tax=Linnemannia exigua TaxID=604196 RepID=A0AAD4DAX8_9FUNG|nr:hypothetical protein BGZ95_011113 [Linnemannia exigua]
MERATAKGPLREHVLWALNKQKGEEHVTLPNFVHKFGYTNKDSASLAYFVLIENSQVEVRRSERLQDAFKEFKLNSEEMFWSEVESKVDTALSSRKSGMITRAAGLRQAAQDYDSHFEDTKSSTTHPGLPPQPALSSTDEAGKNQRLVFETENDPHDEHSEGSFSSFSVHLSMGSKVSPPFAPQSDFSTQEQPSSPGNSTLHEQLFTSGFDNSSAKEDMTEERLSAMMLLNQKTEWKVLELDLLSKFLVFRDQPQSRFSLALDGIADVTQGSEFALTLTQEELTLANVTSTSDPDINASSHHLKFSDTVCEGLNEREEFSDFTWPFIRGALTLVGIRSRCFEIPVAGTKERKNYGRDLVQETEEQALMADGIAVFEGQQIYIAEAALVHDPKPEKKSKDKFKVSGSGNCSGICASSWLNSVWFNVI